MQKTAKLILALLILITFGEAHANLSEKVKIGVHYNPPLCFIDSSGQAQGIFIDIIHEVAIINNWDIEYIQTNLSDGIEELNFGKFDFLTTVARTKEREQVLNFNNETIFTNWGIVYCNKANNFESIPDLNNKSLALEKGDIHAKALLKLLNDFNISVNVIWCENLNEVFSKIESHEADAGAVNKIYGYQQNIDQKLKATPILFNPVNVHIAGGPLSSQLLSKFDNALKRIKKENPEFYQNTINQWLTKDARHIPQWVINVIYILLYLTLILLITLLIQQRVVKKRTSKLNEAQKIGNIRERTIKQLEHEQTLILNSLDEQVVFMDNNYNLVWANDAFKKTSDVPFEQLIGQKCYSAYFNRDTPCEFCNYETCLSTNRTEVREHTSTISGKIFTHKTHPVFDSEHKAIGFVEILSDISEKKKYEEELIAAKKKAEQSDYLKSAFLANMSHEIRTPMNAIIGFSELLEDDKLSSIEKKNYLNIIQSNGNQLLKLISDILIFSQIESGHVNLQYSNVKVVDFLSDIYHQFENEIKKYDKSLDISLECDINDHLELETDLVRLKQIVFNLITNAIKFTEKGSITIGGTVKNEQLNIFVKDTGIGIPKSKHKEVFKRFSQVENTNMKKASGSGLGLTIAHDLIKQLGGNISLESEPDVGSTFYLTHPLSRYNLAKGAELFDSKILNSKK
ncbi:hybrid sensor histidine kinase/response regulator [Carboxylicivirga marina]|uniref:hybrid sensor histidine kinase/response regulator n=1 Tax=Carboxylicivirga marina TaxID=2800988 RepID=UPI002599BE3B|nr:ATP-binding protein [uncultured Carboxylicivirga sp.]